MVNILIMSYAKNPQNIPGGMMGNGIFFVHINSQK